MCYIFEKESSLPVTGLVLSLVKEDLIVLAAYIWFTVAEYEGKHQMNVFHCFRHRQLSSL